MTPKEKAKELVNRFWKHSEQDANYYHAKQCALIAVDEIIKSQPLLHIEYYQQVKEEINKL